jgi:ADP-ribose pyrophosphatase YjhB (NUDIX family)
LISVDVAGHRFQLRVAAVVVHEGHVLLHRQPRDDYWVLPGGRVEAGEMATSTLVREMLEETGEAVECGELLYVVENFFVYAGKPQHEVGLYFRAHVDPSSRLLDKSRVHAGTEGALRLEFRWFAVASLGEVDVRPSFLRESLSRPVLAFQHVVER